jgi:hypothetical protein
MTGWHRESVARQFDISKARKAAAFGRWSAGKDFGGLLKSYHRKGAAY